MKKMQLFKVCFVITLLFLILAPTVTNADTKTSTAEVTIIGGPIVADPVAPPSQLPAGNVVLPSAPVEHFVKDTSQNIENNGKSQGIVGNLWSTAEKVFPKTGSATNFWLLVIGLELTMLALLLTLLKKQIPNQTSLGGNADV